MTPDCGKEGSFIPVPECGWPSGSWEAEVPRARAEMAAARAKKRRMFPEFMYIRPIVEGDVLEAKRKQGARTTAPLTER